MNLIKTTTMFTVVFLWCALAHSSFGATNPGTAQDGHPQEPQTELDVRDMNLFASRMLAILDQVKDQANGDMTTVYRSQSPERRRELIEEAMAILKMIPDGNAVTTRRTVLWIDAALIATGVIAVVAAREHFDDGNMLRGYVMATLAGFSALSGVMLPLFPTATPSEHAHWDEFWRRLADHFGERLPARGKDRKTWILRKVLTTQETKPDARVLAMLSSAASRIHCEILLLAAQTQYDDRAPRKGHPR